MTDYQLVKGQRLRLTKVDLCGAPIPGPKNRLVTKGFVSAAFSPNNEDGNTITSTNANGDTCLREEDDPEFQNYGIELAMCGVTPDVVGFLTGHPLLTSTDGKAIGFDVETGIDLSVVNVAIELWSKVPAQQCVAGQREYGYFLSPFVHGGSLGDFTVQNDAINVTISGARTQDGAGWGVGPYNNVDKTVGGADSALLTPVSARNHLRITKVKGAPPDVTDGAVALGQEATTYVAGMPGTYQPANSYPAATFSGITGKTASPTTAWTTGQYVVLGDGSKASWTGTAWAVGARP